jgi:hypothetical protein
MLEGDRISQEAIKDITEGDEWGDALANLTQRFRRTNNTEICKPLAKIVLDDSRPIDLRLATYCALCEIASRDISALPDLPEFKVPEDFDLVFLRSL